MITVHLEAENWASHTAESKTFENASISDQNVREAIQELTLKGCVNISCTMEDSQSPEGSNTRFTHPYCLNHNGDVVRFVYDDSFRSEDSQYH
jgi:hypothetical protein